MARRAKALSQLLLEVNRIYPSRDTGSDGWIGDAAHRSRPSDHNPNNNDVVQAQDFDADNRVNDRTVDRVLWEHLLKSRDPRIKYVISRGKMFSSYKTSSYPAWTVRPYNGPNGHFTHLHLSIVDSPRLYDDSKPWGFAPGVSEGEQEMKRGDSGRGVKLIQACYNNWAKVTERPQIDVDGDFGPATEAAIKTYQAAAQLEQTGRADGITAAFLLRYEG